MTGSLDIIRKAVQVSFYSLNSSLSWEQWPQWSASASCANYLAKLRYSMRYAVISTPLGPVTMASTDQGLAAVHFGNHVPPDGAVDIESNRVFIDQIDEYFLGKRKQFDFPLDFSGTSFQIAVWRELLKIPYGETRSYGDIAKNLGKPGASRAVGMANHDNHIAIVIPCHRVVGQDGSLTGYAGGIDLKQQLLSLEKTTPLFT